MQWHCSAPSNIALIKYMGKNDADLNLPGNASFSYTLNDLKTFVELEKTNNTTDSWQPLQSSDMSYVPQLTATEQQRFLKHLTFLKQQFNYQGHFIVRSANNFPADCGLASSAASFAALTLCAVNALTELTHTAALTQNQIASLSRQGSGSSCRSFFSPWVLWRGEEVSKIELPYEELLHYVIVVSKEKKAISSSEAHRRVQTSPAFSGRTERAELRLQKLLNAFLEKNWREAHQIVWEEFMDMHNLFETASMPFSYRTQETWKVLDYLQNYWENNQDGPLITLDAGPNIHLLFRPDQQVMANAIQKVFKQDFYVV